MTARTALWTVWMGMAVVAALACGGGPESSTPSPSRPAAPTHHTSEATFPVGAEPQYRVSAGHRNTICWLRFVANGPLQKRGDRLVLVEPGQFYGWCDDQKLYFDSVRPDAIAVRCSAYSLATGPFTLDATKPDKTFLAEARLFDGSGELNLGGSSATPIQDARWLPDPDCEGLIVVTPVRSPQEVARVGSAGKRGSCQVTVELHGLRTTFEAHVR